MKYLFQTHQLYKKLFIVFSILIGLAINVYIIQFAVFYNTKAASTPVEISFSPDTASIPPTSTFNIAVNPKYQSVSFIRLVLHFNPDVLKLTSNIDTSSAPLNGQFTVTTANEANNTGDIEIILYEETNQYAYSQPFQLATLTFESLATQDVPATAITIVDEESQVVSANSEEIPFVTNYVDVNAAAKNKAAAKFAAKAAAADVSQGSCPDSYIDTAIGCIPYGDNNLMAQFFLAWGMGIGGGIAFILIVFSGYMIMTSSGDPKRLSAGKKLLTAAVSGLILLIMSVFILRIVGVDILKIIT